MSTLDFSEVEFAIDFLSLSWISVKSVESRLTISTISEQKVTRSVRVSFSSLHLMKLWHKITVNRGLAASSTLLTTDWRI